jgi:uncharacterized protein (TIGR01319 family)
MYSSSTALLIDFGSTFTKVLCVDLEEETVIARAQAVTTVNSNVMSGLNRALSFLYPQLRLAKYPIDFDHKIACSSAAGGLRLMVIGLEPSLTLEAARQAALGAGAKIVASYHHYLTSTDVAKIESQGCDILLLTGGTDGGDQECILYNARALAKTRLAAPIIVAGNRVAMDDVKDILLSGGKEADVTDNVLPTLDEMNVEPVRALIRELFMKRIVKAKGLSEAQDFVGGNVVMPTPMAVLKGAELLSNGTGNEKGLGELIVVDVGGATTDVHSVAKGYPTRSGVVVKGIIPPYNQRTVEGDLGIRYNAEHIVNQVGKEKFLAELNNMFSMWELSVSDLESKLEKLHWDVGFVPSTKEDHFLDAALARLAVSHAVNRHVASLKPVYVPEGQIFVQMGKDLSNVNVLMGVGGVFAYGKNAEFVLKGAVYNETEPFVLKPKNPQLFIDRNYILYAIGLLSTVAPAKAIRIAKKYIEKND